MPVDYNPSREKLRLAASEMGDELIRLALHGKTENIRCAAIRDELAYEAVWLPRA
jgi:hypothetical protein